MKDMYKENFKTMQTEVKGDLKNWEVHCVCWLGKLIFLIFIKDAKEIQWKKDTVCKNNSEMLDAKKLIHTLNHIQKQ